MFCDPERLSVKWKVATSKIGIIIGNDKYYQLKLHSVKMTNNGHTVKINIPENVTHQAEIVIDETSESFKLVQIHFHWGDKSSHGSEHLLSGEAFPMEMHLVHHNIK